MKRLISIDASTVGTGVAVFKMLKKGYSLENIHFIEDKRTRPKSKKLTKKEQKELRHKVTYERILYMITEIYALLDKYKPQKIIIEDVYGGKDMYAFKMLSRFHGAMFGYALSHGIEIDFRLPSNWRKAVDIPLSDGKRKYKRDELKKLAVKKVKEKFGITVNNDMADAICIGLSEIREGDKNEKICK